MLKTTSRILACLAFVVVAGTAGAQEGMPPLPKAGPEHVLLKQEVGTWDATVELMEAGKPPAVSKGVETVSLIEGGLWIVTDFKATMMNAPFHGHGQTGYDPSKKKFVTTWVDSMSSGITLGESTYDPKTKTRKGWLEGPDATGKPMKLNETTEWRDADTRVFTMAVPGPDGKDIPNMRITYKRRK